VRARRGARREVVGEGGREGGVSQVKAERVGEAREGWRKSA
jgi:hypothetical protein